MAKIASSRKSVQMALRVPSRMVQRKTKLAGRPTAFHPLLRLQQIVGNQAVGRLIRAKLKIGQPGDKYEQEADRVAEQVMRMPQPRLSARVAASEWSQGVRIQRACLECEDELRNQPEEEEEEEKTLQAQEIPGCRPKVIPKVQAHVNAMRGGGQPLPESVRAFFEPRFGYDFRQVRVHTGEQAATSARQVNALAYTVGRDIFFASDQHNPATFAGRWILAHELAHVVQQGSKSVAAHQEIQSGVSDVYERQANAAASAVADGFRRAPVSVSRSQAAPAIMLLTPDEFRDKVGVTTKQKAAIKALFANKTFLNLWKYLETCLATPKKDLGPLVLKVTPGLKIGGVERFGGYSPMTRTLEINPAKPEHKSNPAELVDTITHELIHAVSDLEDACVKAGADPAPLGGAATEFPPSRAAVAGTAEEKKLMVQLGPGASNPCEEFLDINKTAQQMVIQIIRENIKVAKVGRPTVTFVNEILRRNPKAMKAYTKCRDLACAKPTADERSKTVAACSADIIAKFMPKELKPYPL